MYVCMHVLYKSWYICTVGMYCIYLISTHVCVYVCKMNE